MGGIALPVSADPAAPSLGHWLTGELVQWLHGLLIAAPDPPSCGAIGWRRPTRTQLAFPVPGIGKVTVAPPRSQVWTCNDNMT